MALQRASSPAGKGSSMNLMPIEGIDDLEMRLARVAAFWRGKVLDRPPVHITIPKKDSAYPFPKKKNWPSLRDRWFDAEYVADSSLAWVMHSEYLGDAIPSVFPNLGPEVFSAFFGAELEFGEMTSWSVPMLDDWSRAEELALSRDNLYWRKLEEITDALLHRGRNRFFVGLTDIHPGGDAIAAFRDPLQLNMDLLLHRDQVKRLLRKVTNAYFEVFDYYCDKLQGAGQAIANWAGIVSDCRWYVPSNDFSCMISKDLFDEIFLPGIAEECRHHEASLYHLDGPDALRHLDSLLGVLEINAIQWVFGAGHGTVRDWLWVYQKCQEAGKGLMLNLASDDLDWLLANLRPQGLWIQLHGIRSREEAQTALARMERWR